MSSECKAMSRKLFTHCSLLIAHCLIGFYYFLHQIDSLFNRDAYNLQFISVKRTQYIIRYLHTFRGSANPHSYPVKILFCNKNILSLHNSNAEQKKIVFSVYPYIIYGSQSINCNESNIVAGLFIFRPIVAQSNNSFHFSFFFSSTGTAFSSAGASAGTSAGAASTATSSLTSSTFGM